MMAAAAMMFVSCSNEEDVVVNPYEGKTTDVSIAMSVKGSKASASDVNMDGDEEIATIKNVVIVPMVGTAFQNPIMFGDFTKNDVNSKTEKRTLPQTVNKFRVYGNATTATAKEQKVFSDGDLTMSVGAKVVKGEMDCYAPHALYYYSENSNFKMATGTTFDWLASSSWADSNGEPIGTNNLVKLGGVQYKMGVLAALLMNGDTTTDFYSADGTKLGKFSESSAPITVTGITVSDQTKEFNVNFEAQGTPVNVYETAANTAIYPNGDTKLSHADRSAGNVYCVVAPSEAGKTVTLNIEFTVKDGVYFVAQSGQKFGTVDVDPEAKKTFYLPVVLDKSQATSGSGEIFAADYATLLNATVKNWGLASEAPVESSDVTIGVEFDVTWGEGLVFDIDI